MGYSAQSIGIYTAWTPTWTGFSADPTAVTARYTLNGKMCTVWLTGTAGTSNATTCTLTLPFNARGITVALCLVVNNSIATTGRVQTAASSNILTCYATAAAGAFTASGGKLVYLEFTYEIE